MKIINSLSGVMFYATTVVVAVLMLLTVADVSGRYFFNSPIIGTTEITEYLMICLLLGMAPCALAGRMVRIDFVVQHLRPRVRAILDVIFHVAGLGIVAILAWTGFKQSLMTLEYGAGATTLGIPDFPFYVVLIVSYAVLFVVMVVILIKKTGEVFKK